MKNITNVVIVGVGGQGTILASRILGDAAAREGLDVKISEVHGMSQRGGSVITYVRYGEKVYSPITESGEAGYIISFELLEAARALPLLKKGGTVVSGIQRIDPAPVLSGNAEYPDDVPERIRNSGAKLYLTDALTLAKDTGFIKAANVVLMGAFAAVSDIPKETYQKSLDAVLPERFLKENKLAFAAGYDSVERL